MQSIRRSNSSSPQLVFLKLHFNGSRGHIANLEAESFYNNLNLFGVIANCRDQQFVCVRHILQSPT